MKRLTLYLTLLFISSASLVSAGGSVDFPTVKKILQQSPSTWKHLNSVFHFADVGGAVRLGRHWTHLGGTRIAPYRIEVTSKADPSIKFDLVVECETTFYAKNGKEMISEDDNVFTDAVRYSGKFLHVTLIPIEPKKDAGDKP